MTRKSLTPKQKETLLKKWGGKCANCGEEDGPFEWDHIISLGKHGGNNLGNWQPLCRGCHLVKTRRDNQDMRKLKRLEQARKALKEGSQKPSRKKPKGKIQSRGFDKRFRKKMNGKIERRTP